MKREAAAIISDQECPECGENEWGAFVGDGVCWCPICEREWKPQYMEDEPDEENIPFQC